jgi:hypothetical protein
MKKINFFLAILMLTVIFQSCQQQKPAEERQQKLKFEKYIGSYTSGYISSAAPVRINLNTDLENRQPGVEIEEGVFKLEPRVDGKLFLVDSHTLEFRPDTRLESGKQYTGALSLDKLLGIETRLEEFVFEFQVMQQDFSVQKGRLIATAMPDDYMKRYEGTFQVADVMSVEIAKNLLSVSSPFGALKVNISPAGTNEFVYVIDSIPRRDEAYKFTLSWDGNPWNIDRKGSFDIEIPSLNDFLLLDVDAGHGEEQFISLSFSDPLDQGQDLNGLIHLEGVSDLRISSGGSTVTLYPQNRLNGEQTLVVEEQVKNSRGKQLGETKTIVLSLEAIKPQVKIVGNGSIIPGPEGLIMPFKAVGLRAVDVTVYKLFSGNIPQFFQNGNYAYDYNIRPVARPVYRKMHRLDGGKASDLQKWNAFSVDLSGLSNEDPGAFYRVKISFRKEYALYPCGDAATADLSVFEDQELMGKNESLFWDGENSYFNEWPSNFRWSERDDPCTNSYYNGDRFPQRNLAWSRLGVIAKSSDDFNFVVAVTDLLDAKPVSGASVEFYNFQQ